MNIFSLGLQSALSNVYWGSPANISICYIESICYSFMTSYACMYAITYAGNKKRRAQLKLSSWWYNCILGCTGRIPFPFQIFLVLGFMIGL